VAAIVSVSFRDPPPLVARTKCIRDRLSAKSLNVPSQPLKSKIQIWATTKRSPDAVEALSQLMPDSQLFFEAVWRRKSENSADVLWDLRPDPDQECNRDDRQL
jgi:hypothetical protein